MSYIGICALDKCGALVCAQGMNCTLKKVGYNFCKLESAHKKDRHLFGVQKDNDKIWGMTLYQRQGPVVKVLIAECGGVWLTTLDEVWMITLRMWETM